MLPKENPPPGAAGPVLSGAAAAGAVAAAEPNEKVDFFSLSGGGPCPNENAGLSDPAPAPNTKPPTYRKKNHDMSGSCPDITYIKGYK